MGHDSAERQTQIALEGEGAASSVVDVVDVVTDSFVSSNVAHNARRARVSCLNLDTSCHSRLLYCVCRCVGVCVLAPAAIGHRFDFGRL